MMMKPAPASAFIVSQTQLLLQLLIVALDDPAVFRHLDQRFELGFWRQRRYPIFCWVRLPPAATRSTTILPHAAPLFRSPGPQGALAQRQNAIATSAPSLRAK